MNRKKNQWSGSIPKERYGDDTEKADDELKVNPVAYQVGEQSEHTRCHAPEVLDDDAGKCTMLGREQFTGHHETRQNDALRHDSHNIANQLFRPEQIQKRYTEVGLQSYNENFRYTSADVACYPGVRQNYCKIQMRYYYYYYYYY